MPEQSSFFHFEKIVLQNIAAKFSPKFWSLQNSALVCSIFRYMFANVSVQQRRLPTADFLLKEGQSASWVLGAMIITITTSR